MEAAAPRTLGELGEGLRGGVCLSDVSERLALSKLSVEILTTCPTDSERAQNQSLCHRLQVSLGIKAQLKPPLLTLKPSFPLIGCEEMRRCGQGRFWRTCGRGLSQPSWLPFPGQGALFADESGGISSCTLSAPALPTWASSQLAVSPQCSLLGEALPCQPV